MSISLQSNKYNTVKSRYYAPRIYPAPAQICNPINIPNISPHRICAPPNIGPSNLPSLRNNMFTKNVTLPQVFSCISPVQFIYLVSPKVETFHKLIPASTKRQQPQPIIN